MEEIRDPPEMGKGFAYPRVPVSNKPTRELVRFEKRGGIVMQNSRKSFAFDATPLITSSLSWNCKVNAEIAVFELSFAHL